MVVGGGPAGAAAAYHLARRGRSVLVCEKRRFPREKPCGDGLTPRAVRELADMGLGTRLEQWHRVAGLRLHARGRSVSVPFPRGARMPGFGVVAPRAELDRTVLGHAGAAGANVLHGAAVVEPVFRRGVAEGVVVRLDAEMHTVRCAWIVCADGAASRFARMLGRRPDPAYPAGVAVRQYLSSDAPPSQWFEVFLTLSGTGGIPGYGWAFPAGEGRVNAGVGYLFGSVVRRDHDLRALQRRFVAAITPRFGIEGNGSRPRGGRLFSGGSVRPAHGPGYVLAGDAAGMVNPFTGEGIAYAYETGRMAAQHVADALEAGSSPSLREYTDELRDAYAGYYRLGRSFARLMGRPGVLERLATLAMRSDDAMAFLLALLVDIDGGRPHHRGVIRWLKHAAER